MKIGLNIRFKTLLFIYTWKFQQKNYVHRVTGESCTWFDKLEYYFFFFPFIENYTLLFALSCPPVCKPEAVVRGIAIRAKVVNRGGFVIVFVKRSTESER